MTRTLVKFEHDASTKAELIKAHMPLVCRIARHYSQQVRGHYDDLVQVGSVGLLHAIERYDDSRAASIKTYASHLISSEIRHNLRDHVAVVKLPRDLQELLPKIRQAEQALRQDLGREPALEELAGYLDVPLKKLHEAQQMERNYNPMSLEQEAYQNTGSRMTLGEQLEDPEFQSFHLAQEDRILLQDALHKVKAQSRQIIEFAFYEDLTQTEIARQLGISQMQVSRRLKKALGELWETLNTRVTPW